MYVGLAVRTALAIGANREPGDSTKKIFVANQSRIKNVVVRHTNKIFRNDHADQPGAFIL